MSLFDERVIRYESDDKFDEARSRRFAFKWVSLDKLGSTSQLIDRGELQPTPSEFFTIYSVDTHGRGAEAIGSPDLDLSQTAHRGAVPRRHLPIDWYEYVAPQRTAESSSPIVPSDTSSFERLLVTLQSQLDAAALEELASEMLAAIHEGDESSAVRPELLEGLDFPSLSPRERVMATFEGVLRRLRLFNRATDDLYSEAETAERLARTPEEVAHARERGFLVGIRRGSQWFYPAWQFDDKSADGMLTGLAEVRRELEAFSPAELLGWLTLPKPALDGESPVAALQAGAMREVLDLARTVRGLRS